MRAASFAIVGLLACGCGPAFDPATLLNDVRLLAVRADPPEIAAGEMAMLSALHYPGMSVTLDWAYCTEPPAASASSAVNPDCVQKEMAPFLVPLGGGETVAITMPDLPLSQLGVPDFTGGFYLPVRARATGTVSGNPQKTDVGIYRLRVRVPQIPPAFPRNHNPQLQGIYVSPGDGGALADAGAPDGGTPGPGMPLSEGMDVPLKKNQAITLRAVFAPGGAEQYPLPDLRTMTIKMVTETLEVHWYASAGSWDHETSGPDTDVVFTLDEAHLPASGTRIDLYAVGRDERGGTDWLHRTLVYQP